MLALEYDNVIRLSSELRRTCPQPLRLNSCCFHCVHNPCLICTMDDPPSKRRRMPETEQQFIKIDVFTVAGETVQSLWVPSTILGRELLDFVLSAQAHHGSVAKLLHGVSAINKSAPISAQGITDCARLTLVRMRISEQRRKEVVRKIMTGFPYELNDEEEDALNSITELEWGARGLDHATLPSGLQSLPFRLNPS